MDVQELLNKEYTITLRGGILGYLIMVLAKEQDRLNEAVEKDITNIEKVTVAAANDVAGNELLWASYTAAGADFVGFTLGRDPEEVKDIMSDKYVITNPDIQKSVDKAERIFNAAKKAKNNRLN